MDMLDPLEASETSEVETKVMLNEIHIKGHGMDSDEEGNVDHLSPQTLLETPGENEVQYSLRSPEGMITYRVLQVDDSSVEAVPQIVTTGSTGYTNAGVPQVLTSNLNGQLYVIGNPNDMFASQAGTRTIAPRSSIIETTNSVVNNIKKRDERRRATHNEVERRRRDKINNWITKLSTIIPETNPSEIKGNGHYDGQSKGGILAKACDYIMELKDIQEKCEQCLKDNKQLAQNLELVKIKNSILERENKELKELLKKNGILYVPSEISS
ncbi:upstream stimulatory factor 2 isoform X2 [Anoplophora glabripennis]|uniref:upstream stimulatory factor 2 isoform X2 n=1 Tax=Anoplophora glabripennis TaxID=217634 RepID=UPI000873AA01|nr:upstream stimulatory factor 2 isoform X2 [Anoplophora glabripennis]